MPLNTLPTFVFLILITPILPHVERTCSRFNNIPRPRSKTIDCTGRLQWFRTSLKKPQDSYPAGSIFPKKLKQAKQRRSHTTRRTTETMPTPGTTGILFSVEDTRKYSRSPGGPPTFINKPDEVNMKGQCSNRGRQQKNIEPAGKTNHDKARQQQHQDANENMSPPSANKLSGNQRQPPFHSGATIENTTCLTRGGEGV